jgi:hypothetical protein
LHKSLMAFTAVLIALVAGPLAAQPANTDQTPAEAVAPQVDDRPAPTAQGTRAPESTNTDTSNAQLAEAVRKIWEQPVDLQGKPIR